MTYRSVIDPPGYVIRNSTIAVDYWPRTDKIVITHHFLTHAHSDHTKGLDSTWNHGTIYCTNLTKKLINDFLRVPNEHIEPLEPGKPYWFKLNDEHSFIVELINANHCPGAVMYLFNGYFGSILATGDFRYDPTMFVDTPLKQTITQIVDICYLDNTYCSIFYDNIPTRKEALKQLINYIELNPDKKIVIKLKKLGKEDLLIELAKHFKCKILVSKERYTRFKQIFELNEEYYTCEYTSNLFIEVEDVDKAFSSILAKQYPIEEICFVQPTALYINKASTVSTRLRSNSNIFFIPYTDHSSYDELIDFISHLQPKSVIATVKELEANQCNNQVINDMSCFDKYLTKEPIIDSHDQYRLLLQTSSLIRHSKRVISGNQAKKRETIFENTRLLRRKRELPHQIEYETSNTPVKPKNKRLSRESTSSKLDDIKEVWKPISTHVEILSDGDSTITTDDNAATSKQQTSTTNQNDENLIILNNADDIIAEEDSYRCVIKFEQMSIDFNEKDTFNVSPNQVSTQLPQQIINTQTNNELEKRTSNSSSDDGSSSSSSSAKSIVISHTLDDCIENINLINNKLNNENNLSNDNDDKDSYLSAQEDLDINVQINKNDEIIKFFRECFNYDIEKTHKNVDNFITKMMQIQ